MRITIRLVVTSAPRKANIRIEGVTAPGEFVKARVEDSGSPLHGEILNVVTEFGLSVPESALSVSDVIEAEYRVGELRELFKIPDMLYFSKLL